MTRLPGVYFLLAGIATKMLSWLPCRERRYELATTPSDRR
ncbi:hypothetical protein MYSI104531_12700 [Mycobacterium simiae]